MKKLYIFMLVLLMLPFVSALTTTIEDNFNRANGGLGTATNGNVWLASNTGASPLPQIFSNTGRFRTDVGGGSATGTLKISNITNNYYICYNFYIPDSSTIGSSSIYLSDGVNYNNSYPLIYFTKTDNQVKATNNSILQNIGLTWNTLANDVCLYFNNDNSYYLVINDKYYSKYYYLSSIINFNYTRIISSNNYIDSRIDNIITTQNDNFTIRAYNNNTKELINEYTAIVNGVSYATTNGVIYTNMLKTNDTVDITISSEYYITSTDAIDIESDYFILLQPAQINLTIRNEDTNALITQQVNLTVTDGIIYDTYTTSTGSVLIENLTNGNYYEIYLTSAGYNNNNLYLQMNEQTAQGYTTYMNTGGVAKAFTLLSTNNVPIEDVIVTVERFIGGQYVEVTQTNTDVTGLSTIYLNNNQVYRITFSKDNYVSKTILQELTQDEYTVILDGLAEFDFTGVAGGVLYSYTPTSLLLSPSATQSFNFSVSSTASDLLDYKIRLYNGTTLLSTSTGNNPMGSTITLTFNTIPYNNSQIRAVFSFMKDNYTEYQINQYYTIQDISEQSVFSVNDFMKNNVSIRDRIVIWSVIMLTIVLMFSLFGNAFATVTLAALLAPFVAWLVGLSSIIVGFFSLLLILGVISSRSGQQ